MGERNAEARQRVQERQGSVAAAGATWAQAHGGVTWLRAEWQSWIPTAHPSGRTGPAASC